MRKETLICKLIVKDLNVNLIAYYILVVENILKNGYTLDYAIK